MRVCAYRKKITMSKEKLYKNTIVIYTDTDTTHCSLASLGHEAESGDSICEDHTCKAVDINQVPEGVKSFFGIDEET